MSANSLAAVGGTDKVTSTSPNPQPSALALAGR
jgi:hypothetical protein